MPSIYDALVKSITSGEEFALGLIAKVKGSSPQGEGAKALLFPTGRIVGTLGGGCLEAEVRRRACECITLGEPARFDLLLDHDFGWDDGLICGGTVTGIILPNPAKALDLWRELARRERAITWGVNDRFEVTTGTEPGIWLYRETVLPPCHCWIAGSGHIARAVAPLAVQLDFKVTVFDDRPALANREYFPGDIRLRVDYWENLLVEALPPEPVFGLIVTRGHQHDALVLKHWVNQPFAFLGMIGSKRKKQIIFSHFLRERITTEERLASVACPVGLDISSATVPEIAVSIVSQLIQERARFLSGSVGQVSEARPAMNPLA
jgi:xanthine dehydrogenase accessory factor